MSVPSCSTALPVRRARRERAAALFARIRSGLTLALVAIGANVGLPTTNDLVTIATSLAVRDGLGTPGAHRDARSDPHRPASRAARAGPCRQRTIR